MSTQTTIDSDELFIGGEWAKPRGSQRIEVIAASTEEHVGSVPEGTNADIDAAVDAARAAFDDPSGWSSWSSRGTCAGARAAGGRAAEPRRGDRAPRVAAERHADLLRAAGRGGLPDRARHLLRAADPPDGPRGGPPGPARRHGARAAQAGRRGGGDRAVELPADARDVQARAAARDRLHGRDEAEPGDRARQPAARRGRRSRRGFRRASSTSCRPTARWGPTWSNTRASTRSPSPARAPLAARSRVAAASSSPGDARARWQVGRDRARRRRSVECHRSAVRRHDAEQRPDVRELARASWLRASATTRCVEIFGGLAGALAVGDSLDPSTQVGPMASARQRTASRATSPRAATRARASSLAAAARPPRSAAGSSSRRSSPTSPTAPRSRARRSSGRCSR